MLLCEKYRPKTMDEIVLPQAHKNMFKKYIEDGIFPHLLLSGKAGTGKTTIARILINHTECDVIELNASDERGIETIREKVGRFAQSVSLKNFRCVFLDEADGLTPQAQQTLRNLMEKYHNNTRFILTCNYVNKIIDPIQSRCQKFEFGRIEKENMIELLKSILVKENIKIDSEKIDEQLTNIIQNFNFDFRKSINEIQKCSQTGELILDLNTNKYDELINLIKNKDLVAIKHYLVNNSIDYDVLYRRIFETTITPKQIIIISKYYYQHCMVADPEINFLAMACEIYD